MGKIFQETHTTNNITGEVISETKVKGFRADEPSYIKLYLKDISYLYDLPATAGNLLHELLNYVTYGTNRIVLNAAIKKEICNITGLAKQTLSNRLQDLVTKGILEREDIGVFKLNPYLFGRGDWKTIRELRNKNIHLEIVYDKTTGERRIKGNIDE